ncbi:MAG: PIN domain-containing protein [Acidobacteriota bacterium]|nr:PIN domain-containing protein [Acidobacteriota bacterium]
MPAANILIRAVLGIRVRRILETYADSVFFFIPELALSEAQEYLATVVTMRGGDPAKALRLLDAIVRLVDLVDTDIYGEHETEARNSSVLATRTIGPFSRPPLVARSGPGTPTF